MTEPDELSAQFHEIVDLARVDQTRRHASLVFGAHRLRATGEIDDREAPMPKADVPIDPDPARIGAAVRAQRHAGS